MSEFIKLNNNWIDVYRVYQKINNMWVLKNSFQDTLSNLSNLITYKKDGIVQKIVDGSGNIIIQKTQVVHNQDNSTSTIVSKTKKNVNGTTIRTKTTSTEYENGNLDNKLATIDYDSSGKPITRQNKNTDVIGNVNTQNIEYDENENPIVVEYDINTLASYGIGENITGNGVNTKFFPFTFNEGFNMHIRFKTIDSEQPNPPLVRDTEDSSTNYLYNIMSAKTTTADANGRWPGFEIRWAIPKSGPNANDSFDIRRTLAGDKKSLTTNLKGKGYNDIYDFTITLDPSKSSDKFTIHNNITKEIITRVNNIFDNDPNIAVTLGYAINMQGEPYRYSNVTIYDFCVERFDSSAEVDTPTISCDGSQIILTCNSEKSRIYYRINSVVSSDKYELYTYPIPIHTDTQIEAYSVNQHQISNVVLQNCKYDDGRPDEPVITCDGEFVTISCACNATIMYSTNGETYDIYHSPFTIYEDTTVYAYAQVDDIQSDIVSKLCEYIEIPDNDYANQYLTFDVLTSGTIAWKAIGNLAKTISYSINDGEWGEITSTSSGVFITVAQGDKVRFKGTNQQYATSKSNYSGFDGGTAKYNIYGNIMSLIYGDDFIGNNTLPSKSYVFCSIFKQSGVVSAENLVLPATTLQTYCYRAMFSKAHSLEKAPALPATTLATGVYWYMFEECPITEAPELLADTLVSECYGHMFEGCTQLSYIKCLATSGFTSNNCKADWVKNVSSSGTFVKDNDTSWSTGTSGIPTGWIVYNTEVLSNPIITCNGEMITVTCDTEDAAIYYRLNNTGEYIEYTDSISISEDTIIEAYSHKGTNTSEIITQTCVYREKIYTFGGLQVSDGPLYYGYDGYEIADSWDDNSYNSYDYYVHGESNGSSSFNYIEMGQLFENSEFSDSDGDIVNALDPFNGWRLPTTDEWGNILGSNRPGSTVNGFENKHYALVQLTGVTYRNVTSPRGVLVFPDNETIIEESLLFFDDITLNENITKAQLDNCLNQGCMFIPTCGYYDGDWSEDTIYMSSDNAYDLESNSIENIDKSSVYCGVRLVKNATYGDSTPLEGANQSINSWNI